MNLKNLTKISYLVLCGVFLFACSQRERQLESKRTIIAGVVNNFSDNANTITVFDWNPLSEGGRFLQNLSESNGYFRAEHEYVFAQNLSILFANQFINLFVHPGDSVFISIDADKIPHDFANAITFSGNNAELNKELFLWTNYSYPILNFDIELDYTSPETLLASLKREFERAQEAINLYSERVGMSDFLKNWALIDRKFIIANDLVAREFENGDQITWSIFTDPIFDVFNENNFQTGIFQYHLGAGMHVLVQSDAEISRLGSESDYISATRLFVEKLQEKAPKGVVRDVMLFNFLKRIINNTPELYESVPEIETFFSQNFFNIELKKLIERFGQPQMLSETERTLSGISYLENGTIRNLPEVRILNYLADKHEGKVLYIDVWATWCAPCIEEFRFAKNLYRHFEDKDVVFINLCLLSNFESWIPTIERHNIGGENYFFNMGESQLFMSDNNLQGFPSFFIIDKNREIHRSVPRPSDTEAAIRKIESLL
jgi:thiol-disulfide isomerase/thioredoxin